MTHNPDGDPAAFDPTDLGQRPSASKLKPPQEVRDELHRPDEDAAA